MQKNKTLSLHQGRAKAYLSITVNLLEEVYCKMLLGQVPKLSLLQGQAKPDLSMFINLTLTMTLLQDAFKSSSEKLYCLTVIHNVIWRINTGF